MSVPSRWKLANRTRCVPLPVVCASRSVTKRTIRHAIELWKKRSIHLAQLQQLVARPSGAALRKARQVIRLAEEDELAGFGRDGEVAGLIQQIQVGHKAAVVYHREERGLKAQPVREDVLPRMIIDPSVQGRPAANPDASRVLAVVRGVLYACNASNGKVVWATQVGIDTDTLPVRLPATQITPERILVFSADNNTLTALSGDGVTVWQYRLSKACLGKPVIVEQRAFIPTFDGQIHEIELINGTLLGRFQLGKEERLTAGGVRQDSRSNLVYFPADEGCVYVLDVVKKECLAILYTNHDSGSLRGEPVIVPPDPPSPGYMVLTQTAGLDAMQLRVYTLPIGDPNASPVHLPAAPHVPGWTWFAATSDEEKIALLTDGGVLGLFGIRQLRNQDPAVFPQYPAGAQGLDLPAYLANVRPGEPGGSAPGAPGRRGLAAGRSQVVHMQGEDFWVLLGGRLQRLQLAWKSDVGPKLVRVWKDPVELGSPLHDSQVEEDRGTGRNTLFLVTHAPNRPACLMTAVDDEKGDVLWQRQLGLVCQGEIVSLQPPAGPGLPLLLGMDPGGALVFFDPTSHQDDGLGEWRRGGQYLAEAFPENPRFAPLFLRDDTGQSVWQIGCPGTLGAAEPANAGLTLLIRKVGWKPGRRELVVESESRVVLSAAPAGPPVRQGEQLLIPLTSGVLVRVPLNSPAPKEAGGSNWRARRLGPDTPGHILVIDDERFLTCNGLDGVTCWRWGANDPLPMPLPRNRRPRAVGKRREIASTLTLPGQLAAPPLLLPNAAAPIVCLTEVTGWVRLLTVQPGGELEPLRSWDLKGRVTAGPFLRVLPGGEKRIGCVVDQTRLVWLDPDQVAPAWEYHGTETIVGQPQLVKDSLLVADQGGQFLLLNPADGKVSKQHRLRGNISATLSPVAFGPKRAFAPMTDGTVLLLPLK